MHTHGYTHMRASTLVYIYGQAQTCTQAHAHKHARWYHITNIGGSTLQIYYPKETLTIIVYPSDCDTEHNMSSSVDSPMFVKGQRYRCSGNIGLSM